MEGKLLTVSKNILKYLYAVSPCPVLVRRWLASKKDDICFVKSDSDVSACESGLRSLLTSSPVVTPLLVRHGLHDHDRGEHVRRKVWKGGPKNVRVDWADACEKSSGEIAARKHEVVVPGCVHAVYVDHGCCCIVGMGGGLRVGGSVAIYRCLAGGNLHGVGEVDGHEVPLCI